MGDISQAANHQDDAKVEVKAKGINNDQLTWEVALTASSEEADHAVTKVVFGSGQSHDAVNAKGNIDVEKTPNGYVIETPTDGSTYKVDVTTKITDEQEQEFQLRAEMDLDGETTVDVAIAEVKVEAEVEDS